MIFLRFLFLLLGAGLTLSCAALDSFLPAATPILPTQAATLTSTPIWFPPSATPSPQAISTRVPAPEMKTGVGETLFTDDFSRATLWDIAASEEASASIYQNRLNLAAQSGVYMISLRHETLLDNAYAEIAAAPSLCRAESSYGLLIRANASAYYRFSLSCDGTVSAERVSGKTREVLQKPLPSGDAPFGAGKVRIGVWARGAEMRLFLNDRYQFSVESANYPNGALGVFVNAAGNAPIVVSFSQLNVQDIP